MGLFGESKKELVEKFSNQTVRPFFEDARNRAKASQPRYLLGQLERAVANPDLLSIALYCMKKWNGSGDLFNLYASTALFVPEPEILEAAMIISDDQAFPIVASANYRLAMEEFFVPMAERCPVELKPRLFTEFDSSGVLPNSLPHSPGHGAATFFAEICRGRDTAEAIARLRASRAWSVINHRDPIFVEYLDDRDSRLLAALQ